jgi:hypothetical protein
VINAVLYEASPLGFFYGGMIVTGAIATISAWVRHVVFLDENPSLCAASLRPLSCNRGWSTIRSRTRGTISP